MDKHEHDSLQPPPWPDPQSQWPAPQPGYPAQPAPASGSRFWVGFAAGVGATVLVGVIGLVLLAVGSALLFAGNGAGSIGEDPAMDRLYEQCRAGDMAACDELYYQSAMGSELEEFGGTCGGRLEEITSASCTDLNL